MIRLEDGTYVDAPPDTPPRIAGETWPRPEHIEELNRRGYWWCDAVVCEKCGERQCLGYNVTHDLTYVANHRCPNCETTTMAIDRSRGPHVHVKGRRKL